MATTYDDVKYDVNDDDSDIVKYAQGEAARRTHAQIAAPCMINGDTGKLTLIRKPTCFTLIRFFARIRKLIAQN
jgi:hypothetical protein